jgi:eukaryotic translation initiation factor 2C
VCLPFALFVHSHLLIASEQSHLNGDPRFRQYDISPLVSALNLILGAHPSRTQPGGGVLVGRNRFFFKSPAARSEDMDLSGGLEAWRGFYSSVRPSFKQLMVNVNVATTAFYKPGNLAVNMMEYAAASFGARMAGFVKGVRIRTEHLGYKKTIKRLADVTAKTHKFDCAELGRVVTVVTYFKESRLLSLRFTQIGF